MIIVARVLDLVVGVFGVIFALITPAVARVGYIRTRAVVTNAKILWTRYAIAQECVALTFMGIGAFGLDIDARLKLVLVATGGVAFLVSNPIGPPGFDNRLTLRYRRLYQNVLRYYDALHGHEGGR